MAFDKKKLMGKKDSLVFDMGRIKPRCWFNVGALMDIPTANFITGRKGETIINGGLGPSTLIAGKANNYKSAIMNYMMLSAANKIKEAGLFTKMQTYDTELNTEISRLNSFANKFEYLDKNPITETGEWVVTPATPENPSEDWYIKVREYLNNKAKDKDLTIPIECFEDPYTKKELEVVLPTFVTIDSFSRFEGSSSKELLSGNIDGKDANTYYMKAGLFKSRFTAEMPGLTAATNTYFLTTIHVGKKVEMAQGPMTPPEEKILQYLKSNQFFKGAGGGLDFLINTAWIAQGARSFNNQGTKLAEFPRDENDKSETDLNIVKLTILRCKNGASGTSVDILLSQIDGILPSLSEFYYCKSRGNYGIEGNDRNYFMTLYPDVNLSRTTVRKKIDNDPLLRRAINITAEMKQLELYHPVYLSNNDLMCTPKELYEDLKAMGYDWKELLQTRGYWLIDQYENKVPFLSTIDLLKMRKGLYKPYWMKGK